MSFSPDSAERLQPLILSGFTGGMKRNVNPEALQDNEYVFLSNGRNREGIITNTKEPLSYADQIPAGLKQGITGAGSILIVFIAGEAYFRDFADTSVPGFRKITSFTKMSNVADIIYSELVSASSINFARHLNGDNPSSTVSLTNSINGSPVCLVVQDGVSQPNLIFPDGSSRPAKTFEQWNKGDREYVPIGKQMLFFDNGILYVVSPDGKELYRSLTNRPLDFVIAIDKDTASKLTDGAFSVEASRMSYKVSFDPITCIARINVDNADPAVPAGFYLGTKTYSFKVTPDNLNLIFGEPTYRNTGLFATGANNQFSMIDLLGDAILSDGTGLRSFNAIRQFKFEGKNAPFSREVFSLFTGVSQTVTASIFFDNYGMFALDTIYGPGILTYDTLTNSFVSFDQFEGIGRIKQFASVLVNGKYRLFFIDVNNILYEAFASA